MSAGITGIVTERVRNSQDAKKIFYKIVPRYGVVYGGTK